MTPIHRRTFLQIATGSLAPAVLRSQPSPVRFGKNPFTLGVASGDPLPEAVVLWTRLAPEPIDGGGMPPERVPVAWEVAADEKMTRVVRKGTAWALPESAHTIHVDVRGLEPARWYWYRFRAGNEESPIGRTKTAPAKGASPAELKMAFASCQHFETGYFVAYRHMAKDDLDVVFHLGDYIYEGAGQDNRVRKHTGKEIETLTDYRNRHALYKTDPDLQRVHQQYPWIVTWDDHEVDNNYANMLEEHGAPLAGFLERRANAYQAYYEHMPLRETARPKGSKMQLYRQLSYGSLAEFFVLDTRQYRTDQPCGDGTKPHCPEALDPKATIMGQVQSKWLRQGLDRSKAKWNILAQQVMMSEVDRQAGPGETYPLDQWAGYVAERDSLMRFLNERKPANPVVITGDIHSNWVADLSTNFRDEKAPIVGSEFVGTSISSGGNGSDSNPNVEKYLPDNPHVRFYNNQRGYVRCHVTPGKWQSDYRVVDAVTRQDAAIQTRASFIVEDGKPGPQRA